MSKNRSQKLINGSYLNNGVACVFESANCVLYLRVLQLLYHWIMVVVRNTQATLLFRYEPFISFWFRFFDTRRETQYLKVFRNHTMLTTPPTFGTSRGPISNSQLHSLTPTSQHQGRTPTSQHLGRNSTSPHHGRNSTDVIFFKIFQILSPSFLGMTSSTLQPHFLSECLLWQSW